MRGILLFFFCLPLISLTQDKVAIMDFENTSQISKYDGLGKAMSNMLITDLANNIHPRKVVFMERSQLNQILKEQDIQKTDHFDETTAVNFGKIAGVNFIIIGSIYVLDNHCNISSRMVNVETSEIIHSKDVDGPINTWMTLKSNLAQEFANAVNNPISIEQESDNPPEGVLIQYSKVIDAIDENNIEKAENMISMMQDLGVDFEYLDLLNEDIEKIKEDLKELELELEISVTDPIGASNNFYKSGDYINSIKYLKVGRKRVDKNDIGGLITYYLFLHQSYLEIDKKQAVLYCDSILNIYPYFENALILKYQHLYREGEYAKAFQILESIILDYDKYGDTEILNDFLTDFIQKNNLEKFETRHPNFTNWAYCEKGLLIESSRTTFTLQLNCNKTHSATYTQGVYQNFGFHLHWLIECMKNLYSLQEIISYLENITFHEPSYIDVENNDPKMTRLEPYYKPKGNYSSYNTDSIDTKLYFAKNNQPFSGNYHSFGSHIRSKWTQKRPQDCPCELLLTQEEIQQNNGKKISKEITSLNQLNVKFSIGWYSLKDNQPKKSITTYTEVINYFNKEDSEHPGSLWKYLDDYSFTDLYIMSTINLGHGYLLSGDIDMAKKNVKSWELSFQLPKYGNKTIKEVYLQDWEEFYNDGILSEKKLNEMRQLIEELEKSN